MRGWRGGEARRIIACEGLEPEAGDDIPGELAELSNCGGAEYVPRCTLRRVLFTTPLGPAPPLPLFFGGVLGFFGEEAFA